MSNNKPRFHQELQTLLLEFNLTVYHILTEAEIQQLLPTLNQEADKLGTAEKLNLVLLKNKIADFLMAHGQRLPTRLVRYLREFGQRTQLEISEAASVKSLLYYLRDLPDEDLEADELQYLTNAIVYENGEATLGQVVDSARLAAACFRFLKFHTMHAIDTLPPGFVERLRYFAAKRQ